MTVFCDLFYQSNTKINKKICIYYSFPFLPLSSLFTPNIHQGHVKSSNGSNFPKPVIRRYILLIYHLLTKFHLYESSSL